MTLAIVIIALLVLLVIVDGSEASGANRGVPQDVEGQEQPQSGSACILNVTSVFSRNAKEPRRQSWKPARQGQGQTQTTQR